MFSNTGKATETTEKDKAVESESEAVALAPRFQVQAPWDSDRHAGQMKISFLALTCRQGPRVPATTKARKTRRPNRMPARQLTCSASVAPAAPVWHKTPKRNMAGKRHGKRHEGEDATALLGQAHEC